MKETSSELLTREGVFPYDYSHNECDKLDEYKSATQRKRFTHSSPNEHISDEDYVHTQLVWDTFQCKTMRDYHNLYLKTDVLLLADVFESFRDMPTTNSTQLGITRVQAWHGMPC